MHFLTHLRQDYYFRRSADPVLQVNSGLPRASPPCNPNSPTAAPEGEAGTLKTVVRLLAHDAAELKKAQ